MRRRRYRDHVIKRRGSDFSLGAFVWTPKFSQSRRASLGSCSQQHPFNTLPTMMLAFPKSAKNNYTDHTERCRCSLRSYLAEIYLYTPHSKVSINLVIISHYNSNPFVSATKMFIGESTLISSHTAGVSGSNFQLYLVFLALCLGVSLPRVICSRVCLRCYSVKRLKLRVTS